MYTNCFLLYFTIEYYIHACVFNVKSGKIKKSLKPELINNDITFNCVSEANKKKRKKKKHGSRLPYVKGCCNKILLVLYLNIFQKFSNDKSHIE